MSVDVDVQDLARRLVIGRKRDGRSVYDPVAKRELIEVCSQPGVSVTKVARDCGVNANQLSTWVREHQRAASTVPVPSREADSSFVPVAIEAALPQQCAATVNVQARLPNGVVVDLGGCGLKQASQLIEALGRLRCSASTRS